MILNTQSSPQTTKNFRDKIFLRLLSNIKFCDISRFSWFNLSPHFWGFSRAAYMTSRTVLSKRKLHYYKHIMYYTCTCGNLNLIQHKSINTKTIATVTFYRWSRQHLRLPTVFLLSIMPNFILCIINEDIWNLWTRLVIRYYQISRQQKTQSAPYLKPTNFSSLTEPSTGKAGIVAVLEADINWSYHIGIEYHATWY